MIILLVLLRGLGQQHLQHLQQAVSSAVCSVWIHTV